MVELNDLPPKALSAAIRGGTEGWGVVGSASEHIRYAVLRPKKRGGVRKCPCGCGTRVTHLGMANGMCLMSGCELRVRRWVRDGIAAAQIKQPDRDRAAEGGEVVRFTTGETTSKG